MSTIKANQWLNTDGTENFKCRAWVNFNGTGTVAIRASGNCSSITDHGAGDYSMNFTNALADANYSANITGTRSAALIAAVYDNAAAPTTTAIRVCLNTNSAAFADSPYVMIAVFR